MKKWFPEGEAAAWGFGEWSRRRVWYLQGKNFAQMFRSKGALDWEVQA